MNRKSAGEDNGVNKLPQDVTGWSEMQGCV